MAGSRHSKSDMELGRKARQAARDIDGVLLELGFDDDAQDEAAKSLKANRTALKAMLSDDDYERLSVLWNSQWTIQSAAYALGALASLIDKSTDADNRPDVVLATSIAAAIESVTAFVTTKLRQMVDALQPVAIESATLSLKSFGGAVKKTGEYTLKGTGVYYGGKDLYDDTFTAETDYGQERSFVGMPVYYDHALGSVKSQVGTVKAWQATDDGLVFEVELDKNKAYVTDILKLAEKGALGYSTGALSHTVVREAGELKRWIIGEISLTPTPAEPRTLGVAAKGRTTGTTPEAEPEARKRGNAASTVNVIRITG